MINNLLLYGGEKYACCRVQVARHRWFSFFIYRYRHGWYLCRIQLVAFRVLLVGAARGVLLFYARKYYIIFNGCQFNVRLIETGQNRVTRVGFGTFGDVHPKEKEQIG